jgi:ubiquinone/menaquinone biosynthesis C-methylase UbiE
MSPDAAPAARNSPIPHHVTEHSNHGAVVAWAARYDLLVALLTLGRERRFREQLLALAHLEPGESVLDIGCGTGTLAIAAKRVVGALATVQGIDASPEMIARAQRKAKRANVDVTFDVAFAQSLSIQTARFDVVLSTVMLHHLPRAGREQAVREARRVLKPGGRLLAVDFTKNMGKGLLARLHGHGRVNSRDLVALVTAAGLTVVESGPVGRWDLQFVLARRED